MNQWMKIQQNSDMKKYTYYRKKIKSPNSMFSIILFCEGKMSYSPTNIHFSRQGSLPKYQQRTLLANVKSICVRESYLHSEDSRLFFLPGTVQSSFPPSKWMQWTTSVSRWKIWPPSLLCSQTTKQQLWWKSVDRPGCHQPWHDGGAHDMCQVAKPATSDTAELTIYQNWEKQHFLFQFSNYSQFAMERRRWRTKGARYSAFTLPLPSRLFEREPGGDSLEVLTYSPYHKMEILLRLQNKGNQEFPREDWQG